MVTELARKLPGFRGSQARGRCFAHILNLVVKSILCQFKTSMKIKESVSEGHKSDQELEDDTSEEDPELVAGESEDGEDDDEGSDVDEDNMEDWEDEREDMDSKKVEDLDTNVRPASTMLAKVRNSSLNPTFARLFVSHDLMFLTWPL